MAQAQSPRERDDDPLAKMMSTEDGRGAKREGRFRRAISRMVKSQEPPSPETERGHPVHQPVHPHSHNPDPKSDGEARPATEPPTGPFSASAENGYRPASRVSVPNPYTTRKGEVDDVDTGANPVGQWRGVGLDEPEPRTKTTPATTDAMTDNPASAENPERPQAPETADQRPAPAPAEPTVAPPRQPVQAPQGQAVPETDRQWVDRRPPAQWSQEAPMPEPAPRPETDRSQGSHAPPPYAAQGGHGGAQDAAAGRPWPQEAPMPEPAPRPETDRSQGPHAPPPYAAQGGHGGAQDAAAGRPWPQEAPASPMAPEYHQAPAHGPYAQQPRPFSGQAPQGAPYPGPGYQAQGHGQQVPGHGHPPQGYPGYAGHPGQYEPGPHPHHDGHVPPAHPYAYPGAGHPVMPYYSAPQPHPYQSQPLVTYPGAYPAPYQPPGYVLQGQPVVYPGQQFHPYGQPVQHVIVLAAGQQPQVISAESVATLFAERGETTTSEEVRPNKELTGSEPEPETATEPAEAEEAVTEESQESQEQGSRTRETASTTDTAEPEDAGSRIAETVSEVSRNAQGDLLNEALAGLAMRDLSLVDALLEMVEQLETEAKDPDLLDKLFQIDNFATRMRRNGENLLVLTGHDGGESDAHDEIVPLLDVTRAATSEIKDYPRVSLGKIPQKSITGLAADDISHLLAELLDNATANSPEHSQVVISGQELDDGRLMIVVEDEGVGMPEAQLAELNDRLDGEPVLDSEVPKHMGLYVASRIARKHGLETRLEARSFRGISAYTIVPKDLLRMAVPRQLGQNRTSTTPSARATVTPLGPIPAQPANGDAAKAPLGMEPPKKPQGGSSSVTSAGLPRRSATPHGSPLRMMRHPGGSSDTPPAKRADTPPRLTGEARAEQIRDEIGDFLDGERAALEGEDLEGDKE